MYAAAISRFRPHGRCGAALTLAWLAAACDWYEMPTRPESGFLRVVAIATGGDFDIDGYQLTLDGQQSGSLGTTAIRSFSLDPGMHSVEIGNVAANCSVVGANPATARVSARQSTELKIEVKCVATGIALTMRTAGVDVPDSVSVVVDDLPAVVLAANGTLVVGRLGPGDHVVKTNLPAHCTASGASPSTVAVTSGSMTPLAFDVSCAAAVRGPRIAYTSEASGVFTPWLEMVNPDGTGVVRLREGDNPSWARDGRTFAASTTRCYVDWYYGFSNCTGGAFVMDPETGNVRVPSGARYAVDPAWSPTDDVIAVELLSTTGVPSVWLWQLASASAVQLNAAGPTSSREPAWSPDGRRLVFVCWWPAIDLCAVDRDGSKLVRLTDDALWEEHPAWSPDGRTIAFSRYPEDKTGASAFAEIHLLDLASREVTKLTQGRYPAWSPDGSKLAFAGTDGIFVIGRDGTNRARLTTGAHRAPAWRP